MYDPLDPELVAAVLILRSASDEKPIGFEDCAGTATAVVRDAGARTAGRGARRRLLAGRMANAARGRAAHLRVRDPRQSGHRRVLPKLLRRQHHWLHRRHVGREGRHRLHGHVRQPGRQHQVCRRPACHARGWAADCHGGRGHTERERADARQGPARGRPRWGAGVSPPAGHSACAARDASRRRWRRGRRWPRTARALLAARTVQDVTAGGCRRHVDRRLVRPAGHEQADLHLSPGR